MEIQGRVIHSVDVLVIGAGQAGICAAYELQKRGFTGFAGSLGADDGVTKRRKKPALGTFVVLDAEEAPGGAWQHRWPTLTMATINHIADLPGQPVEELDLNAPARLFVPAYFAEFEHENDLPILRPVRVHEVRNVYPEAGGEGSEALNREASWNNSQDSAAGDTSAAHGSSGTGGGALSLRPTPDSHHSELGELLEARTSAGIWRAKFIINCTGTWQRPFVPYVRGAENFRGEQYHTQNYPGPARFWKQRVLVVGGGISAIGHVEELSKEAKKVRWVTRTPPRWRKYVSSDSEGLKPEYGRDVEERVRARVAAGFPPLPVVAETGLPLTKHIRELRENGVLKRKPMFDRLDADGAWWGKKHENFDAIIWATGFRHNLGHLRPLKLRSPNGGIQMDGVHTMFNPRVYLIGYGPSASTVGARRDARVVAREIRQQFSSLLT
ncbi:MAG: NAD(P)-binding domain-containing protein [Arcanobacterium sp.]|nr:NAD(P)-binding domain-containing protein [Arcanobacterium sp.]